MKKFTLTWFLQSGSVKRKGIYINDLNIVSQLWQNITKICCWKLFFTVLLLNIKLIELYINEIRRGVNG